MLFRGPRGGHPPQGQRDQEARVVGFPFQQGLEQQQVELRVKEALERFNKQHDFHQSSSLEAWFQGGADLPVLRPVRHCLP
eukprot:3705937-Pyramimonas_sp.AAC.1